MLIKDGKYFTLVISQTRGFLFPATIWSYNTAAGCALRIAASISRAPVIKKVHRQLRQKPFYGQIKLHVSPLWNFNQLSLEKKCKRIILKGEIQHVFKIKIAKRESQRMRGRWPTWLQGLSVVAWYFVFEVFYFHSVATDICSTSSLIQ